MVRLSFSLFSFPIFPCGRCTPRRTLIAVINREKGLSLTATSFQFRSIFHPASQLKLLCSPLKLAMIPRIMQTAGSQFRVFIILVHTADRLRLACIRILSVEVKIHTRTVICRPMQIEAADNWLFIFRCLLSSSHCGLQRMGSRKPFYGCAI